MKKDRFKEIITNYASTSEDVIALKKLANDYPYSQIVHLLLANSSKKVPPKGFNSNLSNAAFHSTDRSIVKSLIQHNLVPSEVKLKPSSKPINKSSRIKKTIQTKVVKPTPIDSDLLIAEVLDNLEKLQKTKKETAFLFEDDNYIKPEPKTKKKTTSIKKATIKANPKQKVSKAKKQTTIIEKFIKEEPSITKNAKPVNDKEDMAKKSGKMRDDVVSESLAKIYIKQKKNNKAIDIYKKLIWKFPQKKTLFAAQIEKLKKK